MCMVEWQYEVWEMKAKANFHKELLRGHKFSPKRFWNVIKSIRYEKKTNEWIWELFVLCVKNEIGSKNVAVGN